MSYMPRTRNSIFEDLIDDIFGMTGFDTTNTLMKTDIHEKDGMYVLDIDVPGFSKEDIKITLFNGNLTVSAKKEESKESKDSKGNVLRQERYSGSLSRSWYVGTAIEDEDINARYENGTLTLTLPTEKQKEIAVKKTIEIL